MTWLGFFFFFLVHSTKDTIINMMNIPRPTVIPRMRGRFASESFVRCVLESLLGGDVCEGSDLEGLLEAGDDDASDEDGVVGELDSDGSDGDEEEEEEDLCDDGGGDEGRDWEEVDDGGGGEFLVVEVSDSDVEGGCDDGDVDESEVGDEDKESDGGGAAGVGGDGTEESSSGGAVTGEESILRGWSSSAEHSTHLAAARLRQPADGRTQ